MKRANSTTKSDTSAFVQLLELYQTMVRESRQFNIKRSNPEYATYTLEDVGSTAHRLQQPIVITDHTLHSKCNRAEWDMIRQVILGMYEYNALWKCDPVAKARNSTYRTALLGLQKLGLLIPTEAKHFYIVNPIHIRRGDPFGVVATTANMLVNRKPTDDMLTDKRPIRTFNFAQLE